MAFSCNGDGLMRLGCLIHKAVQIGPRLARDALIYSKKLFSPKAKPSKINTLDSRLRGNDDFFSVSLAVSVLHTWPLVLRKRTYIGMSCQVIGVTHKIQHSLSSRRQYIRVSKAEQ